MADRFETLEHCLGVAVNQALEENAADPVHRIGELLLQQRGGGKPSTSVQPDAPAAVPAPTALASSGLGAVTDERASEWTAGHWVASLGVSGAIAGALLGDHGDGDELGTLRSLSSRLGDAHSLAAHLRSRELDVKLAELLHPALRKLAAAGAPLEGDMQSKFAGAIEMSYAGLDTFYSGLEGRIGAPQARVRETMHAEHCKRGDSHAEFTTGNYSITTTSALEWQFVISPDELKAPAPNESPDKLPDRSLCRQPEPLQAILERMAAINVQLADLNEPSLLSDEVLAARLYTGPLFQKYNGVLRGIGTTSSFLRSAVIQLCCPPDVSRAYASAAPAQQEEMFGAALAQANKYTTTLHAVNSCIVKSGKLTMATKVYRGMSGMALPPQFWKPNRFGVRGGVENGFMSTTTNRAVAMGYASDSSRAGLVLEIQQGLVDRGADIAWLSQYPHEREILFGPLTGLEVRQSRVEGAIVILEAALSVNLNALTLEQVISKMKRSHVGLVDSLLAQLRFGGAPEPCLAPLHAVLSRVGVRGREFFNEPVLFLEATDDALKAKDESLKELASPESWAALDGAPEAIAAQMRTAAELLASEGNRAAADLLVLAAERCPVSVEILEELEEVYRRHLTVPTDGQRRGLEALCHFLKHGEADPTAQPWPHAIRLLVKRHCLDMDGTGMAYDVAKAYHPSPALVVQPQPWQDDATPKACKGSALLHAALSGDADCVRAALALCGPLAVKEAVNESMDSKVTPLMLAASVGARSAVEVLLEAGADPNLTSAHGCHALSLAATQRVSTEGEPPIIKALLTAKAEVNLGHPKHDRTDLPRNVGLNFPLLAAVKTGSKVHRIVLALLRAGADVNAQDGLGRTSLMHAIRNDNGFVLVVLFGDPHFLATGHGLEDPTWRREGEAGLDWPPLDVNIVDRDGLTALNYAVAFATKSGDDEVYAMRTPHALLRAGAAVHRVAGQSVPPLVSAAAHGNILALRMLLDAKADVDECTDGKGKNALMVACVHGHEEVISLLLESHANPCAVDANGIGAIHRLVLRGYAALEEKLIAAGAPRWDLMVDGLPRHCRDFKCGSLAVAAQQTGRPLTDLPDSIGECTKLELLNLNDCAQLRRLPDSISGCRSLVELSCRGCLSLTELPSGLGACSHLRKLDLGLCAGLVTLPTELQSCQALTTLLIDGCNALSPDSRAVAEAVLHAVLPLARDPDTGTAESGK